MFPQPSWHVKGCKLSAPWRGQFRHPLPKLRRCEVKDSSAFHRQPPLPAIDQAHRDRWRLVLGQQANQMAVSQRVGNLVGEDARDAKSCYAGTDGCVSRGHGQP